MRRPTSVVFTALLALACAARGAAAQKKPPLTARVGIIGGGISGMRAAAVLQAAGQDYVVLEADTKIGGRMRNTPVLDVKTGQPMAPAQYVELGANWVQGLDGNPVYTLAQECGLTGSPQNWDSVISFDELGRPVADKDIPWRQFDRALECVSTTVQQEVQANTYGGDIDVRAGLRLCGWNPVKPIDYAVEWFSENFEWAETAEMIGVRRTHPSNAYSDFKDADIFAHQQDEQGIARLIHCMATKAGVPADRVKLNTRVTALSVSGNKVSAVTSAGTWTFDYVINTMPIAHMQRNVDKLFGSLYTPSKRAALMQFRMATYTKIFLKFESMFWPGNTQFIMQAPDNGATNMILWQSLSPTTGGFLPGSNIIMVTITDVMSAQMEALPDAVILQKVVTRLQAIYPVANTTGSMLTGYVIPRWYTNDLFGGSYTNWPAGMTEEGYEIMREPVGTPGDMSAPGKILMAGEAACKRMNGYMPGGYAAGERAANQILKGLGLFSGDPDQNICERKLTSNGRPVGMKARGAGRAV
ncbi:MAG: hypothetical protein J3K34DRAFT_523289 [Monoraphidium minutum]|nr:MAG: hypothetical protein J3K34DRAFT_523289 [Monoraphidium minutum]